MLRYTLRTLQSMVLAASLMAGCNIDDSRNRIPGEPYFPDASYEVDAGMPPEPIVLTDCDGTLVDLLRNDDNCGECGDECSDETTCYDAECRTPSYFDVPCGPEGWCPTEDMVCVEVGDENYCLDPDRMGCEFDDVCEDGEVCLQVDKLSPAYCTPISEEICDGLDNDRNGLVDDIPPQTCYSGPEGTAGVGNCHSGVELCIAGLWTGCLGERLPVAEEHILLCDGRDNDCNGCADNNYDLMGECMDAEPIEYDIVVIMDISGSMSSIISATVAASMEFAHAFDGDLNFQFALFSHPYSEDAGISSSSEVPLSDYALFRAALAGLSTARFGLTGAEQNYDIPYMVATGAYPAIGFRSTAKRVYINFTDEFGQSYPYTGFPVVTESSMCSAFGPQDVVAFMTYPSIYSDFDECAITFQLQYNATRMANELRSLFTTVCEE